MSILNETFKVGNQLTSLFKPMDSMITLVDYKTRRINKDNITTGLHKQYNQLSKQTEKKYNFQIYRIKQQSETKEKWFSPQKLVNYTMK